MALIPEGPQYSPLHNRKEKGRFIMKLYTNLWTLGFSLLILCSSAALAQEETASSADWIHLTESEHLDAFRQPTGDWKTAGDAAMDPANEKRLTSTPGKGVVMNGDKGRTRHLLTQMEHGDIEAHIEFMVPVRSNSGVYFQGRYEIQVLDSWGVKEPSHGDCGGIYQRWGKDGGYEGRPPRVNASRKPGEWQSFDVIFRAPRFDADGKKTAPATFEKVVHNGVLVHEHQKLTGPTRSSAYNDEKALGPLMFQGDHGPVAYRNLRIRPLNAE